MKILKEYFTPSEMEDILNIIGLFQSDCHGSTNWNLATSLLQSKGYYPQFMRMLHEFYDECVVSPYLHENIYGVRSKKCEGGDYDQLLLMYAFWSQKKQVCITNP